MNELLNKIFHVYCWVWLFPRLFKLTVQLRITFRGQMGGWYQSSYPIVYKKDDQFILISTMRSTCIAVCGVKLWDKRHSAEILLCHYAVFLQTARLHDF